MLQLLVLMSAQPGKVQIPQTPPPPLSMDDGQMPVGCRGGGCECWSFKLIITNIILLVN